ncbi:hypothetical protein OH76DRAFT_106033 [Lentinus brumalis]|uniref:Uncharacterized protein n=1 Tax=Lentinus brumalis TaxID=2498619 RepID=A0A371CPY4_9APHY|nr:hypothetical protein OH76DRAFT_106033 [Polyporus brumalis]
MRLAAVQSWRSRCSMSVTQYGLLCRTQDGSQPSVAFAAVRRQAIANAGPAFLSPAHTKNRSSVEFEDTSRSVSSAPCARYRHPKSCEEYFSRALLRDLQSGAPVLVDEVPVMLLATAADVALPSIGMTFGAIYICTAVGLMLSGLVLHQTYRYFHLYPEDALYLKLMVGGLLVLDTLHSSTALHVCYYYLVQNYFFPENLAKGVWSIQSLTMETGIIVIVSHWFFARRLFFLADRKLLYLLGIGALLLGELSMCTVATVEIVKKGTFIAFQDSMWTLWAAFSIAVTVDVFCSIGLTH